MYRSLVILVHPMGNVYEPDSHYFHELLSIAKDARQVVDSYRIECQLRADTYGPGYMNDVLCAKVRALDSLLARIDEVLVIQNLSK
jgi:hypothetical protein